MKVFFRNIHLYLSLAAGIVILIACFTGAILVFEKELEEAFNPDRHFVADTSNRTNLSDLIKKVQTKHPEAKIAAVKVYSNPLRTIEIGLILPQKDEHIKEEKSKSSDTNKGKQEKPKAGAGPRPTHTAYVNPYSGEIVEIYSPKGSFFQKTMALHRWLLGKNDGIGKYIVGVSTFIFLFILITGVILWWPKTRNIFLQRIKVKWDGNWKRVNHDLHMVFGFYSAIFLFIFAFTAMSWSFEWFNKGIYILTNTTAESPDPPISQYLKEKESIGFNEALKTVQAKVSSAMFYTIRPPKDSVGIYSVMVLPQNVAEMKTDTYYIDQYNSSIIGSLKFDDKNNGQKIRSYVKPIHTSSIYGTPGKIIGLIVCLLGVTFPVTGVIMWLNRLKQNRKNSTRIS